MARDARYLASFAEFIVQRLAQGLVSEKQTSRMLSRNRSPPGAAEPVLCTLDHAAKGETTWFEGFLLVGVYVLFAVAFFFRG